MSAGRKILTAAPVSMVPCLTDRGTIVIGIKKTGGIRKLPWPT
jgi:hypothetical protein